MPETPTRTNGSSQQDANMTIDLDAKIAEAVHHLQEVGEQLRMTAESVLQTLQAHTSQSSEQNRQQSTTWEGDVERLVQEKPIQSMLVATGLGLLIGLLFKRR